MADKGEGKGGGPVRSGATRREEERGVPVAHGERGVQRSHHTSGGAGSRLGGAVV
jgi:hypothetical protein